MHHKPRNPRLLPATLWRCALAAWLCACASLPAVSDAQETGLFRIARRQKVDPVTTLPATPPAELPAPAAAPAQAPAEPAVPALPDPTDRPPTTATEDLPPGGVQYLGSGYVWFDDNTAPPVAGGAPGPCWPAWKILSSGKCLPTDCWRVEVDAIFLNRSRADSQTLLDDGVDEILNVTALDFDAETGARLAISRRLNACYRVEAAWFGISDWQAGASTNAAFNLTLPTGGTVAVADATFAYNSQFHSVELNLRRQCTNWFEALAGARWIALDDQFAAGGTVGSFYAIDVENRLYGAQLGGRATVLDHGGRFFADFSAKFGLFGNAAEGTAAVPLAAATVSDHDSQASLMVDLDLRGRWQFHPRADLHVGYQMLWLDELMLAAEQFDLGVMHANGHLFMHGPHIGFEFRR